MKGATRVQRTPSCVNRFDACGRTLLPYSCSQIALHEAERQRQSEAQRRVKAQMDKQLARERREEQERKQQRCKSKEQQLQEIKASLIEDRKRQVWGGGFLAPSLGMFLMRKRKKGCRERPTLLWHQRC